METKHAKHIESREKIWPDLALAEWEATYDTIHLWTQIVGKLKLQFTAFKNHYWNAALYPTISGLTTGIVPCGDHCFEIDFDFVKHRLNISISNGEHDYISFKSSTTKDFYFELKEKLSDLGIEMNIWTVPVEIEDRTPFDQDTRYREFDPVHAGKFLSVMVQSAKTMEMFRSCFSGKASPVQFFWGSFDLSISFYSGNPAPKHPGSPNVAKKVMVEAMSSEVATFGFWPGKGFGNPIFFAYVYPQPKDYVNYNIQPSSAYYDQSLSEFILPYSHVRADETPERALLEFFESAYMAVEKLSGWNKNFFHHYLYNTINGDRGLSDKTSI